MKQLENTIQKLKSDPLHAVTIVDHNTTSRICLNKFGADMMAEFGSVEAFFEDLNAKGITAFKVFERRKNGNALKPVGEYDFDIVAPAEVQPKAPVVVDLFAAAPAGANPFGLMGGLNMMDIAYKTQDHNRLSAENLQLRSENERLKEERAELKEKIMQNQYSADKSKSTNELLTGLAPILMPILSKMTGGGAEAAGALAAPMESLSPVRAAFMQMIKGTDDQFLQDLYLVAQGMTNEDFDNEITALVAKYNLNPMAHAV